MKSNWRNVLFTAVVCLIAIVAFCISDSEARDVKIEWDALDNGQPYHADGISKYELHYGVSEGSLTEVIPFTAADLLPNPPAGKLQYLVTGLPDTPIYGALKHIDGGTWSGLSNTSFLDTVPPPIVDPPVITQNIGDITVVEGEVMTLSITATGEGLNYLWQSIDPGASAWVDQPQIQGPVNTGWVPALAVSGTKIRCIVSNSGGSVTSNEVTLTVTAPQQPPKPPLNFRFILNKLNSLEKKMDKMEVRLAALEKK